MAATIIASAFAVLVILILVGAFSRIGLPAVPEAHPAPTADRAAALRKLEALQAPERDLGLDPACATRVLEPAEGAQRRGVLVVWHGFTNCPAQFAPVAERLAAAGYEVLLAREPRHGLPDRLGKQLAELRTKELVEFVDACIDIAAGLGGPVHTLGLSVGGTLAAYAAATRTEVDGFVAIAPLVAPKAAPVPVVRLLVRMGRRAPATWIWWDPSRRENLGESPYVYPGFPLRGLVPFLHLADALRDGTLRPGHRLQRVALIDNPGDFAIRRDAARSMVARGFAAAADECVDLTLDASLGWWHDFVDPWGRHHGEPDQVARVVLAALGEGDDPTAGGLVASTRSLAEDAR